MSSGLQHLGLHRQQGAGAVELVLATAFLIIPIVLLVMSLPILVEYRSMGDSAAREAARACAVADDPRRGQERSERIAHRVITERGFVPDETTIDVDCVSAWKPGGVVTASVSFRVPAVYIAGIGEVGTVTISRTYTERIEPHRSRPRE